MTPMTIIAMALAIASVWTAVVALVITLCLSAADADRVGTLL
jgi:hypothetical protein